MEVEQYPDEMGWDVKATLPKVLADDFRCIETGPITHVRFWGSWKRQVPSPSATIRLEIYEDIPADQSRTGYSMPGNLLWQREFYPGQAVVTPMRPMPQGWFDPNTGDWAHPDHEFWDQYDIDILDDPFIQIDGEIYWLAITSMIGEPEVEWG